jgi:DNA invertase Pin-like site-specific DNA recombinase
MTPFQGWANGDPNHAAGGRRRYNRERQEAALERRYEVVQLFKKYGVQHGSQRQIARELGVADSTISNDCKRIWHDVNHAFCPTCGARLLPPA